MGIGNFYVQNMQALWVLQHVGNGGYDDDDMMILGIYVYTKIIVYS